MKRNFQTSQMNSSSQCTNCTNLRLQNLPWACMTSMWQAVCVWGKERDYTFHLMIFFSFVRVCCTCWCIDGGVEGTVASPLNADAEVDLNKTKTRNCLVLDGTLISIMMAKMAGLEPQCLVGTLTPSSRFYRLLSDLTIVIIFICAGQLWTIGKIELLAKTWENWVWPRGRCCK